VRKDKQLYRCTYTPLTIDGHPVPSESGLQPHVDVMATSADQAMRLAHAKTGCPVDNPTRIEGASKPTRRAATARRPRPVIQLVSAATLLAVQRATGAAQ
jgi:hypothetical protein